MRTPTLTALFLGLTLAATSAAPARATAAPAQGRYASINALKMYYEVHGTGAPLVLLHGGLCTIDSCFGKVLPALARTRKVIAIEQQAHGHTGDIAGRPLSYEQMTEDTAALLTKLGIENADVLGYSVGGAMGLRLAIRHPKLVRRLIVLASAHSNDGWDPAILKGMAMLTPEVIPQVFRDAYARTAPDPKGWATLVGKIKQLAADFKGWREQDVRAIQAPVLVIVGDRDIIRPEYSVQLYRMLPHAQLAVLPNSDHFAVTAHADWVVGFSTAFLDAPSATGQVAATK